MNGLKGIFNMLEKNKNIKEKNSINEDEIKYKIEVATQILDRNISFVTNCDNKTSIILTVIGVLLTIIMTNEGLNEIFSIVRGCLESKNFCDVLYLICFMSAIVLMLWGMFNLGSVLIAKTTEEAAGKKEESSRIFFSGIRKSGTCKDYNIRFHEMSKEDLLNDLIEQVYINSDIASLKYKKYNLGLKQTVVGFILFVSILLIGIYIY